MDNLENHFLGITLNWKDSMNKKEWTYAIVGEEGQGMSYASLKIQEAEK